MWFQIKEGYSAGTIINLSVAISLDPKRRRIHFPVPSSLYELTTADWERLMKKLAETEKAHT